MTITVLAAGPQALVEDLGRPGFASSGVSASGAADRAALRLANRLVGNPESAAGVECVLGGLTITTASPVWVAVTGAPTTVEVNGIAHRSHRSYSLQPGDALHIATPAVGLRNYLAVRGGIDANLVLGSAATDVLSGLGSPPVVAGDELALGTSPLDLPTTWQVPWPAPVSRLTVHPGPRMDWFTEESWQQFDRVSWTITPDSNRIATRLTGCRLTRRRTDELPSEAIIPGAIQVPADGYPLIFGPDHPVTGGYPVIGVLDSAGCDALAQRRPGETVHFARTTPHPIKH